MTNLVRKTTTWPKVLLFGDSITQFSFTTEGCWGSLLSDYLQRRCDVLARGFSGYNTRWCKVILPSILDTKLAKDTVAMTIFLGVNDSNSYELNPRQHVPLDEYRQNLTEMINFAVSQGINRESIILISPSAFDITTWAEECRKKGKAVSKDNEVTSVYAKACCSVAEEMGTKCVDLYSEMMKIEDYASYLSDGLHLSQKGSRLLFDQLQPIIENLTSKLPIVWFPFWDEVDLDNVEKSLLSS
uniref:Isoamyl acetate-hydrolyzing esterase 1 homolog n=2 Tax=Arion vulgaris TaxID=1028688 RepID=A0A0B7BEA7_9EUPU